MNPRSPKEAPEALVLRALKLGDLLVAVPAIHALRRGLPHHRLILAVPGWLSPIVDLIGGVDLLLPTPGLDDLLPLEPGRIDVAANLHGNGAESRRIVDALEPRLRIVHGGIGPRWLDGILERERWARLVSAYGFPADPGDLALERPRARPANPGATVIHVGSFYGSRRWPAERFAEVGRRLAAAAHRVVFTGSGDERPRALEVARLAGLPDSLVLAGRQGLDEFAAEVAHARLVVSADTGAAHLASAYGIASVVLFGPAPPEEWGPPPGPHIVLTDPTVRRGDAFADEPDPALLAVSVEDVLAAIASLAL